MIKIRKIANFFKDFINECKVFYTIYSFFISTITISLFIFYFSENIECLFIIESIILITPILYFLFFSFERKIICENFYYVEKLGRYKTKAQLIDKRDKKIIIINSKTYLFYLQLKIGRNIKSYELFWKGRESIEINLGDILPFLNFKENRLICKNNYIYSYNVVIEFTYLNSLPVDFEFVIYSKIKKKKKGIKKLNIQMR